MLKTAIFGLLTVLFTFSAWADSPQTLWTRIDVPNEQVTQLEVGYPMGCAITTILYALKFGPSEWRIAYVNLPGDTDAQKVQSLAAKLSSTPSQNSKGSPIFSEKYGVNPNDIPSVFQVMVQSQTKLSSNDYLSPLEVSSKADTILKKFHSDLSRSLASLKPVLLHLYFSKPDFSHAILVTGVRNLLESDGAVTLLILDPMTGKVSDATVRAEQVDLVGNKLFGLSFFDLDVGSKKGVIISAQF